MFQVKSLFHPVRRNRYTAIFLLLVMIGQMLLPASAAMPAASSAAVTLENHKVAVKHVPADSGELPANQFAASDTLTLLPDQGVVSAVPLLSSAGTATDGEKIIIPLMLPEEDVITPAGVTTDGQTLVSVATVARSRGVIVRYKDNRDKSMQAQSEMTMVTGVEGVDYTGTGDGATGLGKTEVVQVAPGVDLAGALAMLRQDPLVEYAEPNYEMRAQDVPNDLRYGEQWGLREIEATNTWSWAWEVLESNAATPVTVAVVDTGVDVTHEDLAGRVLAGRNTITGAVYASDTMDNSTNGHGTHVAGIIASVTNNVYGIAGVAEEFPVSILPVKVLDAAGVGTMYDVAQGIKWAADHGAKVINLSMGARLPDYPLTLAEAVEYAQKQGALVIAAAGNDNLGIEGFYPASLPGVLPVGATGSNHHPASFSNNVGLKAPGVGILSTLPGNRYGTMSGTSQASAFASGVAALLWTTVPVKSAGAISGALLNGQRDYPEGPHYYWWGTIWDYHYRVLNARVALTLLINDGYIYNSLDFIQPKYGSHVAGTTRIMIQVSNPDKVGWVNFALDAAGTLLAKVYGPAGGNTEQGDLYIYDWDTTTVTDGKYQLSVTSYGSAGQLASSNLEVIVANQQEGGLFIQIEKPDGSAGAGASVSVYHLNGNPDQGTVQREFVFNGQADLQGRIVIPGITAADGNDFLVIAHGSEPNYLYSQIVHAPGLVTLDASGTRHVTISGRRTDGQPLAAAVIVADLQVPSLSGQSPPITPDYLEMGPMAILNASGTTEAYLTQGLFRLRLVSAADAYYLVKHDLAVTDSAVSIEFHPQLDEVSTLQLAPDMDLQSYGVKLTDVGDYYDGFIRLEKDQVGTLTPGTYSAVIDAVYRESAASTEWLYGFKSPDFVLSAGANGQMSFGGPVQASLATYSGDPGSWPPGEYAYFRPSFTDAHGNGLITIAKQGYSPVSAPVDVLPTIEIRNGSGQLMGGAKYCSLNFAYWLTSGEQTPGDYFARVKLNTGPLGQADSGGAAGAQDLRFSIAPGIEPPPDLTVTVIDRGQNLVQGTRVVLLQKTGSRYEAVVTEKYTDNGGMVRYTNLDLSHDGSYALAIYGDSSVPGDSTGLLEPVFLVVPLTVSDLPNITVDMSAHPLQRISLQAFDKLGASMNSVDYYAYYFNGEGEPGGMKLKYLNNNGSLPLWVAEGRYAFQAVANNARSGARVYHMARQVNIPTPNGGTLAIGLGGEDLAQLNVILPAATNDSTYTLGGLAIFSPDLPFSPALFPYRNPIYLTPGNYQLLGVLVNRHYDGEWDYWLTGQVTLPAAGQAVWNINDAFTADLSLDQASYGLGENVLTTHRIEDSHGNLLVAVATNLGLNYGFSGASGPPVQGQNHRLIAPFLVIKNPSGLEISRYKLEEAGYNALNLNLPTGSSTFFKGEYSIPTDAIDGEYLAVLELGAGPGGLVSDQVSFGISAAPGAPLIEQLTSPTNAPNVTITGASIPDADVAVSYTLNGGAATLAGTVRASASGQFSLDVALPSEGSYAFAAVATKNNLTGMVSASMSIVVDRTAPGPPASLVGAGQDQTHILLTWTASPTADVTTYRIHRDGQQVGQIAAGASPSYLDVLPDSNLPGAEYQYAVTAVDAAGNVSIPVQATAHVQVAGDRVAPSAPGSLLVIFSPGGRANLQWDAATDNVAVAGYRIYRAAAGGAAAVVGTVYGAVTLSYQDSGLAAETQYIYTITAFDAAGNESAAGAPVSKSTSPLLINNLTYFIPRNVNGLALANGTLQIILNAELNRQAVVEVVYQSWLDAGGNLFAEPRPVSTTVALTEASDGRGQLSYKGVLTLDSGIAELTSITATLSDGAGHTANRTADGLPITVTGSLRVNVIAPPTDYLQGAQLFATSGQGSNSSATAILVNPGSYELKGLTPGQNYTVRITTAYGYQLAIKHNVEVIKGQVKEISLEPGLPASLDVQVVENDGVTPIPGIRVEVHSSGAYINAGLTGENGWSINYSNVRPVVPFILSGKDLEVKAALTWPQQDVYLQAGTAATLTLVPGTNQVKLVLQRRPVGTLQGVVTDGGDIPLAGARIVVVQDLDGRVATYQAMANGLGEYTLQLPAQDTQVTASHRLTSTLQQMSNITANQLNSLNFELQRKGTVYMDVYTRRAGQPEYLMDMDWRVSVHFQFSIRNLSNNWTSNGWGSTWPYIYVENGQPGDQIEIKLDGQQAAMTSQTQTVTLDANNYAKVEFHLVEHGEAIAKLRDEQGYAHPGVERWVGIYQGDGPDAPLVSSMGSTRDDLTIGGTLDPGSYTAIFYWHNFRIKDFTINYKPWENPIRHLGSIRNMLQQDGYVEMPVVFQDGEITDLGDIVLPYPQQSGAGYFRGQAGNSFSANVTEAIPGSVVTLRASYSYAGGQAVDPRSLKVTLDIPNDTTLVTNSIQVKVTAGSPDPLVSINPDNLGIDLGDEAAQPGGVAGTVTYQVYLSSNPAWPTAAAKARLEYLINGSSRYEELGTVVIDVPRVTISAPGSTLTEEITVSGRAPAGSRVDVYDYTDFIGSTTASPYGVWRLPVTLADWGEPSVHYLTAEVPGEPAVSSVPAKVIFDPTQPVATSVTMYQQDGRSITFDPTKGVASFPYVWVPGMDIYFDIDFNNPERVSGVAVQNGSKDKIASSQNASFDSISQKFLAQGQFFGNNYMPGAIFLTYDVQPGPYTPAPIPEESILRKSLPPPWRDATTDVDDEPLPPADSNTTNSKPVTITLGGDSRMQLIVNFSAADLADFTPSAEDLAAVAAGGPPVYNLQLITWESGGQLHYELTAVIPKEHPFLAQAAGIQLINAQSGGSVLVKVFGKSIITGGLNVKELYDTIKGGFGVKDRLDKISKLIDKASNCESAPIARVYRERGEDIAYKVLLPSMLVQYGVQLAILALGAGPLGSLALYPVTSVLNDALDATVDKRIKAMEQSIKENPYCPEDPEDPSNPDNPNNPDKDKNEVAKPWWIIDPSGYIYEAVPSNRLEGVTATALVQNPDNSWSVWDASWYEQENPVVTDTQGRYAWDVPEGNWQVAFAKAGYEPASSDVMHIPPPRTDVNVAMVSLAAPVLTGVTAAAGGGYLDITFDKYMRVNTLTNTSVTFTVYGEVDEFGEAVTVEGTMTPVNPEADPNAGGVYLARTFRFTPAAPLTIGGDYQVRVSQMVQSYAERPMVTDDNRTVTILAVPDTTPPGPVTNLQVIARDGELQLVWQDPGDADFAKVMVYRRVAGAGSYGTPVEVLKGINQYTINGLTNGMLYDVKLTTVDTTGNESTGVTGSGRPVAVSHGGDDEGGTGADTLLGGQPGNQPDSQSNSGAGQIDEVKISITSGPQNLAAFDQRVFVDIPADAFPTGTTLVVRKISGAETPAGSGRVTISPVYEFDTGGIAPNKPVLVNISYDQSLLAGLDPRKLGIYRQDEQDPSRWTYAGGSVALNTGVASVRLHHFSRYTVMLEERTFTDLQGHWSQTEVEILASRQVVNGINQQKFAPNRLITRAEMTRLLLNMLALDPEQEMQGKTSEKPTFSDVAPAAWYYKTVETAARRGFVKGGNGLFRPNDTVTRQEMAVMIIRALGLEERAEATTCNLPHKDESQVSAWAAGYVTLAWQMGLMQGVRADYFNPRGGSTRAQASVVVLRAMELMGQITTLVTFKGTVVFSEVEGQHYELKLAAVDGGTQYVLAPASEYMQKQLAAAVGQETSVTGTFKAGVDSFMRGPILRVLMVGEQFKLPSG